MACGCLVVDVDVSVLIVYELFRLFEWNLLPILVLFLSVNILC